MYARTLTHNKMLWLEFYYYMYTKPHPSFEKISPPPIPPLPPPPGHTSLMMKHTYQQWEKGRVNLHNHNTCIIHVYNVPLGIHVPTCTCTTCVYMHADRLKNFLCGWNKAIRMWVSVFHSHSVQTVCTKGSRFPYIFKLLLLIQEA